MTQNGRHKRAWLTWLLWQTPGKCWAQHDCAIHGQDSWVALGAGNGPQGAIPIPE